MNALNSYISHINGLIHHLNNLLMDVGNEDRYKLFEDFLDSAYEWLNEYIEELEEENEL